MSIGETSTTGELQCDLAVIGGGGGGLAAAVIAAVVVLRFVAEK